MLRGKRPHAAAVPSRRYAVTIAVAAGLTLALPVAWGPGHDGIEAFAQQASAADVATVTVTQPPNLVVIITDDQTAESFPRATPRSMPYLYDRMNDPTDHWVYFPNAFLNTPLCCPTRATVLSGQYSHKHGVQDNSAATALDQSNLLPVWLDDVGYNTGLFGKYLNHWPFGTDPPTPAPGWDRWVANMGNALPDYYTYDLSIDGVLEHHGTLATDYNTDVLANYAVQFVNGAPLNEPMFLYFAPVAPHGSHVPAPRHKKAFPGASVPDQPNFNEADVSDKPQWIKNKLPLTDKKMATFRKRRLNAYRTLLAVDEAIERIVDAIDARGQLDNTVIVFMTDNGYSFGEHRFDGKKCVYEECIRTPFLVRSPGATQGTRTELVSSVDVAPTLVELSGATAGRPMDGMSLVPLLTNTPVSWRTGALIEFVGEKRNNFPGYWAIRTADYLYSELSTGEKELYDLTGANGPADPFELENRASDPAYSSVKATLAAALAALKAS